MAEPVAQTEAVVPAKTRMPAKPRFRRSEVWVALRPIRKSRLEAIPIGTELKASEFRRHHLFRLWRRNSIGPKGHPWTEFLVARRRRKDGLAPVAPPAPPDGPAESTASELRGSAQSQRAAAEGGTDPGIEVEEIGGGWYRAMQGGVQIAKIQGLAATNVWLREHGYKPIT